MAKSDASNNEDDDDFVLLISNQGGAHVLNHCNNVVFKRGTRVHYCEEVALRLVKQHTSAPVPEIVMSSYDNGVGSIAMDFIHGSTLTSAWDAFDDRTKEKICRDTWTMIMQWREIPRPADFSYQCLADGSAATEEPLLKDLGDPPTPLNSDEALRERIYQRYLHYFGRRYEHELPGMLPRSSKSVFTHGDIAPQNIMVDQNGQIAGIIDWELAGWYPEYWEYANIMKPRREDNWQEWMDGTAPQKWDISGIAAARRVLF